MKNTVLVTLVLACGTALAGPTCTAPEAQWIKEADFRKGVEAQGYTIKAFKVTKGRCYEIYGSDTTGKKVDIYYDPATARVLESKS